MSHAPTAMALGDLDIRLWSQKTLHPTAQNAVGEYRNLRRHFNGRHIYWNDHGSHLLVFLRLGQNGSWTLCKCHGCHRPPSVLVHTLGRLVAKCRRSIKATYQTLQLQRSLWHGHARRLITLSLPAGKQFFFNESQSFEELLSEFAADPPEIQERLQLSSYQARPIETTFFMADISMKLGLFDRPPLNLWTLGSYFYHTKFSPAHSPC